MAENRVIKKIRTDAGDLKIDYLSLANVPALAPAEHTHTPEEAGAAPAEHTHNYAGSDSVGGPANSVSNSVTIQANGTSLGSYDGSEEKTFNITPAKIGALPIKGGTLTGDLNLGSETDAAAVYLTFKRLVGEDGFTGRMYVNGTDGSTCIQARKGTSVFNKMVLGETETTFEQAVSIESGGTGAKTAAKARENLNITPANIGALSTKGGILTGDLYIGNDSMSDPIYLKFSKTVNEQLCRGNIYINSTDGSFCMQLRDDSVQLNKMALCAESTEFVKPVSVASGGTGAKTKEDARKNLGFVHSETEQATGDTWINGKPIYKRVISGEVAESKLATWGTISDLETVVNVDGMLQLTNLAIWVPLTYGIPDDNYTTVAVGGAGDVGVFSAEPATGYVIIEYTKTTD